MRSRRPSGPRPRQERARSPYLGEPSGDLRTGFRGTSRMRRLLTGLLLAAVARRHGDGAQRSPTACSPSSGRRAAASSAGSRRRRCVPSGSAVLNVGGAPADIAAVSPDGARRSDRRRREGTSALRPARHPPAGGAALARRGLRLQGGVGDAASGSSSCSAASRPEVVVVDPTARRVLRREQLAGTAMGAVRAGDRVLDAARATRRDRAGAAGRDRGGRLRPDRRDPPGSPRGARRPQRQATARSPGLARARRARLARGRARASRASSRSISRRWPCASKRLDTRTTARATKLVEGWGRGRRSGCKGTRSPYSGWSTDGGQKRPRTIGVRIARRRDRATTRCSTRGALEAARAGLDAAGPRPRRAAAAIELDGTLRYDAAAAAPTRATSRSPGARRTSAAATARRFARRRHRGAGGSSVSASTAKPTVVLAP